MAGAVPGLFSGGARGHRGMKMPEVPPRRLTCTVFAKISGWPSLIPDNDLVTLTFWLFPGSCLLWAYGKPAWRVRRDMANHAERQPFASAHMSAQFCVPVSNLAP